MKNKAQFRSDAKALECIMQDYSGSNGAYFGFITQPDGQRHFLAGGRADLGGLCLSEGIATLIYQTPGLDETFIDTVCEVAHEMLYEKKRGVQ